jgi:hypothetical protein
VRRGQQPELARRDAQLSAAHPAPDTERLCASPAKESEIQITKMEMAQA